MERVKKGVRISEIEKVERGLIKGIVDAPGVRQEVIVKSFES